MSAADLSVRPDLRPGDLWAVESLVRGTGFFSEEEVAIARELVQQTLERGEASGYSFLLAEQAGQLSGYSCYGDIPGTRGSFDLYWIVVAPAWQRRGIGRLLLQASEQAVRGLGGRHLYVETSSRAQYEPTRAFYLRNGYVQAASLEDFYAPGDGKLIYLKRLGAPA